jgi:hypothetical protein
MKIKEKCKNGKKLAAKLEVWKGYFDEYARMLTNGDYPFVIYCKDPETGDSFIITNKPRKEKK